MAEEKESIIIEVNVESSIDKLAELKTEINDLIKLRQELAEKSKAGDLQATKSLEALNSTIRNTQTEYKAQQRVLDGYTNSVKNNADRVNFANNSIQANRDLLKQLTAQYINTQKPSQELTNKVKQLSDTLKQQEAAIGNTSRNVGNYGESFKDAFSTIASGIPGLEGFATAQRGINLALEANPIGAVIALFTGLFQIFSKNKEIADQVSFAFNGLNKAFGFIVDTIVNTVTSFDKLAEAVKSPLQFIKNLATGTANAAKEGYNAAKAFDELTVANAKLNAQIAVGQEKADALTRSLKDRTKSERERIDIANKIADLEISNAKNLAKLRQDELNALKLQNKDRTLSGEEQAKVIQKQGEVEVATLQAITAENQRQTRINILLEKEKTASTKDGTEKRNELRTQELKSIDEVILKEQESANKKLDAENERELNAQVLREKRNAERIGSVNALVDAEIIARNRLLQNEELTATERENIISSSEERILAIREEASIRDIRRAEQTAKAKQQIAEAEVGFAASVADSLIGFTQQVADVAGADAEFQKALALVEIGVKTATALAGAISQAQSVPYPGNLVAIATGIGAVLGGIASAIATLNKVPATPKAKFATGIIGLDGEGTETSDSIPAYLSKGESVLTAKATRRFHRELAWMEMAVGNSPNYNFSGKFATGFIPTVNTDGGFVARDIARNSDTSIMIQEAIKNGFALAPAPKLSIVELEAKQSSRNRSVKVSEA